MNDRCFPDILPDNADPDVFGVRCLLDRYLAIMLYHAGVGLFRAIIRLGVPQATDLRRLLHARLRYVYGQLMLRVLTIALGSGPFYGFWPRLSVHAHDLRHCHSLYQAAGPRDGCCQRRRFHR